MAKLFEAAKNSYPADMPQLTSLRFFVAILIVFRHYIHLLPIHFPTQATGLDAKSPLLVDFFFILSGFILTHVYMQDIAEKTFSFRDYWIRRFARVYPVYIFALIFAAIVSLWARHYIPSFPDQEAFTLLPALEQVFLIHGWGLLKRVSLFWNVPSWSISVEWFIYLFFPFMIMAALRLHEIYLYLFSIAAYESFRFLSIYLSPIHSELGMIDITSPLILIRCMSGFFAGVALCRFGQKWQLKPRYCSHPAFLMLVCALMAMAHFRVSDYILLPMLPLVVMILSDQARHNMKGIMTARILVYLGQTAYSLYLMHFLLGTPVFIILEMDLVSRGLLTPSLQFLLWMLMFPVVIIIAAATHEFIEKPGRAFIVKKFSRRKTARALTQTA